MRLKAGPSAKPSANISDPVTIESRPSVRLKTVTFDAAVTGAQPCSIGNNMTSRYTNISTIDMDTGARAQIMAGEPTVLIVDSVKVTEIDGVADTEIMAAIYIAPCGDPLTSVQTARPDTLRLGMIATNPEC
jgi:hypothetical protein